MLLEKVGMEAMLKQTAEECVELAHAAMKIERELEGVNKTHRLMDELIANFEEEVADILVCCHELGLINIDIEPLSRDTKKGLDLLIISALSSANEVREDSKLGRTLTGGVPHRTVRSMHCLASQCLSIVRNMDIFCEENVKLMWGHKIARMEARIERDESCGACRYFYPEGVVGLTCQKLCGGRVSPKSSDWCYDFERARIVVNKED